jgi:uncharacterized protein (TIGR02466 family)
MALLSTSHFATLIYEDQKPEWVSNTLEICQPHFDYIKKIETPSKTFPVHQTLTDLYKDPKFEYLTTFILSKAREILISQGYNLSNYELFFDELWAQEVLTYGHHLPHVHNNCQISGFFFLECPGDGTYPIFYDPRPGKPMTDLPELDKSKVTLASHEINCKPAPGLFLFFNSWLMHCFDLSGSDKPTKFLHFNIGARKILD